jgi:D-3-phosphoglycerate dehydrogenase
MAAATAYIDCSALMRSLLDEIGPPAGMRVFEGDPELQQLADLVSTAIIVLNGHTAMDAKLLASAPQLKSIIFLGTGASSYVDMAAAERSGIVVRTIRGYGDRTVAEHAFALMLSAARDVAAMDRGLRHGRWSVREGLELQGRTLGLVGVGGIGAEMARIASGFGLRVIAWNRSPIASGVPVEAVPLDDLLAQSDAVSLHLALTPETRGIIGARHFARMKRGALLVNTARGALVDEPSMIAALRSGQLGHAALDVFESEPLPAGHLLTELNNVTLTAHAGWKSRAASRRLLQIALDIAAADAAALAAGQSLSA